MSEAQQIGDGELSAILERFDVVGTNRMSAKEAGYAWATKVAAYSELWAAWQLLLDLYEVDQGGTRNLAQRWADYIGAGRDVFWMRTLLKRAADVSHQDALEFLHAASDIYMKLQFFLERRKLANEIT